MPEVDRNELLNLKEKVVRFLICIKHTHIWNM